MFALGHKRDLVQTVGGEVDDGRVPVPDVGERILCLDELRADPRVALGQRSTLCHICLLASRRGLEPRSSGPEPGVLPLN